MRVVPTRFKDRVDRRAHVLDKEFRLREEVVVHLVETDGSDEVAIEE